MWNFDIFFIHGEWAGSWLFNSWTAAFASEGWSARSICLPGHGPGENPRGLGLLDYVEAVEDVIWQPERTVLVGHSMGGWVAMKVHERLPVASTVLLSPVPAYGLAMRASTGLTRIAPGSTFKSIILGAPSVLPEKAIRRVCFNEDTEEDAVRRFVENAGTESPTALRQMMNLNLRLPGRIKIKKRKLSRNGGKNLIVSSEGDFFVKPDELAETGDILNASMIKLKSYPHCYPYIEKGAGVRELVMDWLESNLNPAEVD